MQVSPTTSTTNASAAANTTTAQAKAMANVDYNSFLKMLIAQMKNQDPMNPSDPTQFVSQLASFSAVEQAIQTNSKLDSLLVSNQLSQAESAIGRTITSADGKVSGAVVAVTVNSSGVVALTDKGDQVPLTSGIVLS